MRALIFPVALVFLTACAGSRLEKRHAQRLGLFGTDAPPGTITLNDSLFYDMTEISNFAWHEFEFWSARTFGTGSQDHEAVLPDTTVWNRTPFAINEEYYLRHPAYYSYPVVGISYDQALAYSKWRSDRVMEVYLIRSGIIPYKENQTGENYFTIERFYATDSLKAHHYLPYPQYDLPSYQEWQLAVALSDRLSSANLKHCKKMKDQKFRGATFTECADVLEQGLFVINSQEFSGSRSADPISNTSCSNCTADLIWHIRGNVAELSLDSTIVLGEGWQDPLDPILSDKAFPSNAPNAYTGMRNICRWQNWNGQLP